MEIDHRQSPMTAWYGQVGLTNLPFSANADAGSIDAIGHLNGLRSGVVIAGRYRVEQPIGSGAFSVVWSAWDLLLHRRIAIKVYSAARLGQLSIDETRIQASCQHPNVMPLYDAGCDPLLGISYLAMPLYPGSDLGETLNRYGPLPFRAAISCVDQICSAVEFLWQRRQIVHGDIKPSNIWLTHSGAALLMDFNLPGVLVREDAACGGTPGYTAPEVFHGYRDQSGDVFSLGCVLYYCLAGCAPYTDNDAAASGSFTPLHCLRPEIRPELEAVVHRAIHPDPRIRYLSARELRSALRYPARKVGISWIAAFWAGISECARFTLRILGAGYATGWRLLTRFVRHAFRKPGQACVEAVVMLIAYQFLRQWLLAHRYEIEFEASAGAVVAIAFATINAKLRKRKRWDRR